MVTGIYTFLFVSNTFQFKDNLFSLLYPKPASLAQEETLSEMLRKETNQLLQDAKSKNSAGLLATATKRKVLMLRAGVDDPPLFLKYTLPEKFITKLPDRIQQELEKSQNLDGELKVLSFDNFEMGSSWKEYHLNNFKLKFVKGEPPVLLTGDKIEVKGVSLDDQLIVDLSTPANLSITASSSVLGQTTNGEVLAARTTQKKIAVVPFNFTNNTNEPLTLEQLRALFFDAPTNISVQSYYSENSFGKVQFTGDIYPWTKIPYFVSSVCDYNQWAALAIGANAIRTRDYDHVFFIFPKVSPVCNWAGLGEQGGKYAWANGTVPSDVPTDNLKVYASEIGHNLGFEHAGVYVCGSKAIDIDTNCSASDGNIYDSMGTGVGITSPFPVAHFNAPHKDKVKWLNVRNVTRNGTFTIPPLESPSSLTQALSIPIGKGRVTNYYYVEYRQPIGFDNFSGMGSVSEGVSINLLKQINNNDTLLLRHPQVRDPIIQRPPAFALADSESFLDEINGIKVEQLSHNVSGATVKVTFGPGQCARHAPDVKINLIDDNITYPGGTITYSVVVTSLDSSTCSARSFQLREVVPNGWTGIFSSSTVTMAPGENRVVSWIVDSPDGSADGLYDVVVEAVDIDETDAVYSDSEGAIFIISSLEPSPSPTSTPIPSITLSPTSTQPTTTPTASPSSPNPGTWSQSFCGGYAYSCNIFNNIAYRYETVWNSTNNSCGLGNNGNFQSSLYKNGEPVCTCNGGVWIDGGTICWVWESAIFYPFP